MCLFVHVRGGNGVFESSPADCCVVFNLCCRFRSHVFIILMQLPCGQSAWVLMLCLTHLLLISLLQGGDCNHRQTVITALMKNKSNVQLWRTDSLSGPTASAVCKKHLCSTKRFLCCGCKPWCERLDVLSWAFMCSPWSNSYISRWKMYMWQDQVNAVGKWSINRCIFPFLYLLKNDERIEKLWWKLRNECMK